MLEDKNKDDKLSGGVFLKTRTDLFTCRRVSVRPEGAEPLLSVAAKHAAPPNKPAERTAQKCELLVMIYLI